jgi:alkanesulfonate monooxygenase SsuD/methylene tetrahydromethanopterin reductase-like flavin-dependent oxidoreductase (luciferase family)
MDGTIRNWKKCGGKASALGTTGRPSIVLLASDEADFSRLVSAWASRRGLSEESARWRLGHSLAGTPRQVCERLKALEAAGVGWVFLLFDDARDIARLRLFAEAVMPEL